jgi:hypothetical protein
MPVGNDLVANGRAQNLIVLDQQHPQDLHPLSHHCATLSHQPDRKLTQ